MLAYRLAGTSVAVALLSSFGMEAEAQDRRVTIVNETRFDIVEFYGSNVDAKTWEEDILGSDILPAGSSVVINFDDGTGYCLFDFRAVFEDGDVLEEQNVDVCEISTFRYHE
jgi:hypothetical protein